MACSKKTTKSKAKVVSVKAKPEFPYDHFAPRKTKELVEVEKILALPVFQKGARTYAVRVLRHKPKGFVIGYYQTYVKADNIQNLRLKLIKNIKWDLSYKWPAYVLIYNNTNIDKYNHAGYLQPNLYDHSFFVWTPDDGSGHPYDIGVNPKTGGLTRARYEVDTNIPYKPKTKGV